MKNYSKEIAILKARMEQAEKVISKYESSMSISELVHYNSKEFNKACKVWDMCYNGIKVLGA